MDYLYYPSKDVWYGRQKWFEDLNDQISGEGSYLVSEQASALMAEVEAVFCAGAWISVVILSLTVIDAHLRDVEVSGFQGNTKKLIEVIGDKTELQQLRIRRNSLIHVNPTEPAITIDQQWFNRDLLEAEAKEAVRLMLEVVYLSPGI